MQYAITVIMLIIMYSDTDNLSCSGVCIFITMVVNSSFCIPLFVKQIVLY
jgi:hypothetical protein